MRSAGSSLGSFGRKKQYLGCSVRYCTVYWIRGQVFCERSTRRLDGELGDENTRRVRLDIEMLYGQISARLPEDRRSVMESLMGEFEMGTTMRLLLAFVAGANQRERQILRLLMTDIEKMEAKKGSENQ